jgi:predicted DCC family thiol-disulfide oxidoreductase YuxK
MPRLLVLYDSFCPFCARCREWLEHREQDVRLVFLCCRSDEARARYGAIRGMGRELVVIDERTGWYWIGPAAFVLCLWALSSWRWISKVAALAFVWPFARELFALVSDYRGLLSGVFGPACTGEQCGLPPARSPYR